MSLSELTHYAAVAKQSWAEYLAQVATMSSFASVDAPSFPGPLLPGESWLSDSLQIIQLLSSPGRIFFSYHTLDIAYTEGGMEAFPDPFTVDP